ncbi:MAG: hypothetical protein LBS29_04615 [Endomicrobium sp.]|jgi:hypothetical protein|nr:hypothetical protein [Endomicrobium sp.]
MAFILSIIIAIGLGIGVYVNFVKKDLRGSIDNVKTITINVGRNMFYDVDVPAHAILLESNYENYYKFDILLIELVDSKPRVVDIVIPLNAKWLAIDSKDGWLIPSLNSVNKNSIYTHFSDAALAINSVRKDAIYSLPSMYTTLNGTFIGTRYPQGNTDNVTFWITEDGFVYSKKEFSDYASVLSNCMATIEAIHGVNPVDYYYDGNIFYFRFSDFAFGVKNINKNTQFSIVSKGHNVFDYFMNTLFQ